MKESHGCNVRDLAAKGSLSDGIICACPYQLVNKHTNNSLFLPSVGGDNLYHLYMYNFLQFKSNEMQNACKGL